MEKISTEDIANLNTVWELPKNKKPIVIIGAGGIVSDCLLYTSPSPRDTG